MARRSFNASGSASAWHRRNGGSAKSWRNRNENNGGIGERNRRNGEERNELGEISDISIGVMAWQSAYRRRKSAASRRGGAGATAAQNKRSRLAASSADLWQRHGVATARLAERAAGAAHIARCEGNALRIAAKLIAAWCAQHRGVTAAAWQAAWRRKRYRLKMASAAAASLRHNAAARPAGESAGNQRGAARHIAAAAKAAAWRKQRRGAALISASKAAKIGKISRCRRGGGVSISGRRRPAAGEAAVRRRLVRRNIKLNKASVERLEGVGVQSGICGGVA